MLSDVDPGLKPLYDGCKRNRDNWEKLQEEHDKLSTCSLRRRENENRSLVSESLWSDSASQVQET